MASRTVDQPAAITAAVNAADDSGRSVAAAPAFRGAGGAGGPGVAALFVTSDIFVAVNMLAAAALVLSFMMFALSSRGDDLP